MNPEARPTRKRTTLTIAGAALVTAGAVGGAAAMSDDDATERPIPAAQLARAERAALDQTGGGRVTGTDVDDEESRYEVEVTLKDGTQVDVQLDDDFEVVGTENDGVDRDGTEGPDEAED